MRSLALFEPFLMFGLIFAFVWELRPIYPYSWIAIPILMLISHLARRESPRSLGFELHNLTSTLRELAPVLILVALLSVTGGAVFHTLRPVGFTGFGLTLAVYLPWGLVQQYALNGYFLNRLTGTLSGRTASLIAALLFSAVHAPNPFLMIVTFPLGWIATLIYRRHRNLYVLGIAHGIIGVLLFITVPDSVSRHLRIGPGWYRFRPTDLLF